jgi:hypothetical protein
MAARGKIARFSDEMEAYEAGRWPAIILRRDPRAALVPRLPWADMKQAVGLRSGWRCLRTAKRSGTFPEGSKPSGNQAKSRLIKVNQARKKIVAALDIQFWH